MALYDENYTRYQLDRSLARRVVREFYLRSAAGQLRGPTVDFGCGVGDLLRRLPAGSVGLDINPVSVEYCRSHGLDARVYDGDADDWNLDLLDSTAGLKSLVISHVLEHLEQPMEKLARLLHACGRLGIERALVIVPGWRGYQNDDTHRTFVDLPMLSSPAATAGTGFALACARYFPGNLRSIGQWFPHHELQVSYRNVGRCRPAASNPDPAP
ncbi:MAG: class I SAM-dependent methyltransferase [Pseudomonadota bacterium]|nr:class I SAM-dependent methyltransferase [Pseudomonadota bacterium]